MILATLSKHLLPATLLYSRGHKWLSSDFFKVSTDLGNLENLEKSGKFLFLKKSGNFVKLDQESVNFSRSHTKIIY